MDKFNIAIDGPAGAGKSTIARLVAQALGYIYVDTGAMYRAVTWEFLQTSLQIQPTAELSQWLHEIHMEIKPGIDEQQVYINGRDVTPFLRSEEVTSRVSEIASIEAVRKFLVTAQQQMASKKGVVMDGRDIGTKVIPDAEIKIFLTASIEQRAKRRLKESQLRGQTSKSLLEIEQDIAHRDRMDEQRAVSPLIQAQDAILLDSSYLTIDEVVAHILKLCEEHGKRRK